MSERTSRCAVYTRKSSEEGLEQAYNSLDAQREAGVDYIKSQKHQGWVALPARYDDGGYSGGSTDRPGLQRLLADIQSRRVDVVVVYKVDRLSRSLADFARLMQTFDEHQVSFVSVTQQFNTTTSMGRLTLNMLLSFAQFEREVTGERIRDKIAATKRKGIWVGGIPPIGYRLPREDDIGHTPGDRTLRVVESEAAIVRSIFQGYVETGSLVALVKRLEKAGHTTRRWRSAVGTQHGGRAFSATQVYKILTNPIYLGKITHTRSGATAIYDASHEPIVSRALWDAVQSRMARIERETRHRWTHTHLLRRKIRTFEGYALSPQVVQKVIERGDPASGTRLTRYYTSQKALKQGYAKCPIKTINAGVVDDLVRAVVMDYLKSSAGVNLRPQPPEQRDYWIRDVVQKVIVAPDRLTVEIERDRITQMAAALKAAKSESERQSLGAKLQSRTSRCAADKALDVVPTCPYKPDVDDSGSQTILSLRVQIKRMDGRRVLLTPGGDDLLLTIDANGVPVPNERLVRAIGQAFAWRRELLKSGERVSSLCERFGVTDSWIHQSMALTRLSPSILRGILTGQLKPSIRLDDLLAAAQHLEWKVQYQVLGLK